MKKILMFVLCLCLVFGVVSCGNNDVEESSSVHTMDTDKILEIADSRVKQDILSKIDLLSKGMKQDIYVVKANGGLVENPSLLSSFILKTLNQEMTKIYIAFYNESDELSMTYISFESGKFQAYTYFEKDGSLKYSNLKYLHQYDEDGVLGIYLSDSEDITADALTNPENHVVFEFKDVE